MARTVNQEEYAEKRNDILNAVQRLVYTKGFEQMTIQDILDDLKISKGAFYHYFDSKQTLLEALVDRMMVEAEQITMSIVEASDLTAIEKFQQFFSAISSWKVAQKSFVIGLLRVWFADENAIVRDKVNGMMTERIGALFNLIIHQGIEEGVFETEFADHAGEVVISLLVGLQYTISKLMFAAETSENPAEQRDEIVAKYAVYLSAMERTLGAPEGSLFRIDADTVQVWIDALRELST